MKSSKTGDLGHALLGLLRRKPASGYDLCKIFSETPQGGFSDSPGAIYPALRRLEKAGLASGRIKQAGLRQRKIYRITARGASALTEWLERPVTAADVSSGVQEALLRFVLLDSIAGPEATLRFLYALWEALTRFQATLRAHASDYKSRMSMAERLVLQNEISSYGAQIAWTADAIRAYKPKKSGKEARPRQEAEAAR